MRYFDYNATTPLAPAAREAWLAAQDEFWANPSGPYRASARARNFLERQRARIADFFEVEPARVVFTSGATEGNNAVLRWAAEVAETSQSRIAISAIEHPCVREAAKRIAGEGVVTLPVDGDGVVEIAALDPLFSDNPPALVSVLAASNETGVLQPWQAVAARCRRGGVRFHCDAVQWIGKLPLQDLANVDFVTASGHKFGGPKGVGFVLLGPARSGFCGQVGGGQEDGHRAGTEDLAGIAAMVAALEARLAMEPASHEARDAFIAAMKERGAIILGERAKRLPNSVALIMPRFDRTRWIHRLDRLGFAIGSGSACSTGKEGPSAVLTAMGVSPDAAQRALRISGGPDAAREDWEALTRAFAEAEADLERDEGEDRLTTVIQI